jgi:DNA polymerase I-like protein with 3'-5' exonuclease and polymerase domains
MTHQHMLRFPAAQAEADRVVGEAVNLASPRELSEALYTTLRLQPPPDCFGRWSPTSADCPA